MPLNRIEVDKHLEETYRAMGFPGIERYLFSERVWEQLQKEAAADLFLPVKDLLARAIERFKQGSKKLDSLSTSERAQIQHQLIDSGYVGSELECRIPQLCALKKMASMKELLVVRQRLAEIGADVAGEIEETGNELQALEKLLILETRAYHFQKMQELWAKKKRLLMKDYPGSSELTEKQKKERKTIVDELLKLKVKELTPSEAKALDELKKEGCEPEILVKLSDEQANFFAEGLSLKQVQGMPGLTRIQMQAVLLGLTPEQAGRTWFTQKHLTAVKEGIPYSLIIPPTDAEYSERYRDDMLRKAMNKLLEALPDKFRTGSPWADAKEYKSALKKHLNSEKPEDFGLEPKSMKQVVEAILSFYLPSYLRAFSPSFSPTILRASSAPLSDGITDEKKTEGGDNDSGRSRSHSAF